MAKAKKTQTTRAVARLLARTLPPDELEALADELATETQRAEDVIEEKREVSARLGGQLKLARLNCGKLAQKVKERAYMGYTVCDETPDFERSVIVVTRRDTGESWDEPMEPGPQQTEILASPPPPPEIPETPKGKGCVCPRPGHVSVGETWSCPEHGHMWIQPHGEREPYKFNPEAPEKGGIDVTLDKITLPVLQAGEPEVKSLGKIRPKGQPLTGGEPEGGWPEGTVGAEDAWPGGKPVDPATTLDTRDIGGRGSAAGEPEAESRLDPAAVAAADDDKGEAKP